MITSLCSEGQLHFAISHSNTDQDTFMLFMKHLVNKLDIETPGWQVSNCLLQTNLFVVVGVQYHLVR